MIFEKKRGRPKTEDAKDYGYRLRMSGEDIAKLEYIHKKTGESKADILRRGLNMAYNLAKYAD